MKTEKEIRDSLQVHLNQGINSKMDEKVLFAKISLLQWILTCDVCKRVECNCHEPF